AREHDACADRRRTVPGAVLRGEDSATILIREHRSRIERQAEIGRVRLHFDLREGDFLRRLLVLVLRGADLAAAIPGESEMLPGSARPVELTRGDVVAH